jgi:hypothetical protein
VSALARRELRARRSSCAVSACAVCDDPATPHRTRRAMIVAGNGQHGDGAHGGCGCSTPRLRTCRAVVYVGQKGASGGGSGTRPGTSASPHPLHLAAVQRRAHHFVRVCDRNGAVSRQPRCAAATVLKQVRGVMEQRLWLGAVRDVAVEPASCRAARSLVVSNDEPCFVVRARSVLWTVRCFRPIVSSFFSACLSFVTCCGVLLQCVMSAGAPISRRACC